jgi:hypothetical protein
VCDGGMCDGRVCNDSMCNGIMRDSGMCDGVMLRAESSIEDGDTVLLSHGIAHSLTTKAALLLA